MEQKGSVGLRELIHTVIVNQVPAYANKFFYSLGFLSGMSFLLLILTGSIMTFFGPSWWFTTSVGTFIRSVHLWAVQAFIVFIILHLLIVFLTGGYRAPRQFVWVLGALMFFFTLVEAEFGYVLRGDFSSQWRSLQGADLYNGSTLGQIINNLNYAQVYGVHIIIVPLVIIGLLFLHYGLVRMRGIAKPYRADVPYRMVPANHTMLFIRGFVVIAAIIVLAVIFPSPLIAPVTIKQIAMQDPNLMAQTLISEINHTSDTATYIDNIAPYQFDTKKVYVDDPYRAYIATQQQEANILALFNVEDKTTQDAQLKSAGDYFDKGGQVTTALNKKNPAIPLVSRLILLAQSGLYEAALNSEENTGDNATYSLRFLSDTGVLEDIATKMNITTPQYGMLREEKGSLPPGAWWLAPLGLMDNTLLKNDDNQDRDGAEILGIALLLFIAFPYIPYLNQLPDKLGIYKLIWKDKKA